MGSPYDKILTGVGLIEGGGLSKAAKDKYVDEVIALLLTGNADGKGSKFPLPLPPAPGPTIFNVTTLEAEPVFWFGPDPVAALCAAQLKDPAKCPFWHKIFLDLIYEKTAVAMDIAGGTPLFPIFDVSVAFPDIKIFPILPPALAVELKLTPPDLTIKLLELAIKLNIPKPPIPPIPPLIELPEIKLVLPQLLLGLISLPFELVVDLTIPPKVDMMLDLPGLPGIVLKMAFDIVFKLLVDLNLLLITPKVFIASILIYIKNVVAMVCVDVVGSLVGSGGAMTKSIAGLTGLI